MTRAQVRNLEERSAQWVAKHLVMAGRLIDLEPELAFQHALAASRRGGRLAAVREAVGVTAYAAGHYGEALREFRTYRRISGSNVHLPVMADCERGLGRPDRALDLARGEEAESLDAAGKAELAMVVSGARADLGQLEAAVAALEIPQLDLHRAFPFSPRLFRAYADALDAVGRSQESGTWRRQAAVAEKALGLDDESEPDIIDLGDEDEDGVARPVPSVADVLGTPARPDTASGIDADTGSQRSAVAPAPEQGRETRSVTSAPHPDPAPENTTELAASSLAEQLPDDGTEATRPGQVAEQADPTADVPGEDTMTAGASENASAEGTVTGTTVAQGAPVEGSTAEEQPAEGTAAREQSTGTAVLFSMGSSGVADVVVPATGARTDREGFASAPAVEFLVAEEPRPTSTSEGAALSEGTHTAEAADTAAEAGPGTVREDGEGNPMQGRAAGTVGQAHDAPGTTSASDGDGDGDDD